MTTESINLKKGQYVVYPFHGVGVVDDIEEQEVCGQILKLIVVFFQFDKMTLRIPYDKAEELGLRTICSREHMDKALKKLKGKAKAKKTMWSRRAQEYETKINSGDPVSIAEVVRDLYKLDENNEQSFSERQIYEMAFSRLAREVAVIEKIQPLDAEKKLDEMMRKQQQQQTAS
jgi:CarD family transcriptional regulator